MSNNQNALRRFLLYFFISLFLFSCKRTVEVEKVDFSNFKNKEIVEFIRAKPYDFTHLAAKAKVNATLQNKSYSFTTHIRWEFDQMIWMSFTMFGIEGYRLLIQPDSFKMIDKLNNQYLIKPFSHFQQLAGVDISFYEIQELLMGQMLFTDSRKIEVDKGKNDISLLAQDVRFTNLSKLETLSGNIISQYVQDNYYGRKMTIQQGNYYVDKSGKFPMQREISISDNNSMINVQMEFNRIKTEESQEYPFDIPSKYRKVD